MGASRIRLVRQGLTESFVLSAIGGLLGVGLAWLTLDSLVANLGIQLPDDHPQPASTSSFLLPRLAS